MSDTPGRFHFFFFQPRELFAWWGGLTRAGAGDPAQPEGRGHEGHAHVHPRFLFRLPSSGRRLLALAAALALLATAAPAAAQSTITLVENTSGSQSNHWHWAQSITTGSQAATVSDISITLAAGSGDLSVRLRSDSNGSPGTLLATFITPTGLSHLSGTVATFTAPANTVLAANTTYWISGHEGLTSRRSVVRANGATETGVEGWTIGNTVCSD